MFFKSFRFGFQCYLLSKLDMKTQNYKTAAMLMSQTNSVGDELFSPVIHSIVPTEWPHE